MPHLIQRTVKKFYASVLKQRIPASIFEDVLYFCKNAQVLRTPENCSKFYNGRYDSKTCKMAMTCLREYRLMGAYTFEADADPHPYMRQYIIDTIPEITRESTIMEVGPGNHPLFSENEYPNWHGCDINYNDGTIDFSNQVWGKGLYQKIYTGSWDNLADVCRQHNVPYAFDLVCGSHSFEHTSKPITALKQAARILKGNDKNRGGGGGGGVYCAICSRWIFHMGW